MSNTNEDQIGEVLISKTKSAIEKVDAIRSTDPELALELYNRFALMLLDLQEAINKSSKMENTL